MVSLKTLKLFLCCSSSVLLHQIVLVYFSHVGFGEAVEASCVTVVPRIRKTKLIKKDHLMDYTLNV